MANVYNKEVTNYMLKYYIKPHCVLCGNTGIFDTRGVTTRAGWEVGTVDFCLCPNGQVLRYRTGVIELEKRGRIRIGARY